MDPKNRELLIRAAGMLEGASWTVEKDMPAEFLLDVAEMIYQALGVDINGTNDTKEELYDP